MGSRADTRFSGVNGRIQVALDIVAKVWSCGWAERMGQFDVALDVLIVGAIIGRERLIEERGVKKKEGGGRGESRYPSQTCFAITSPSHVLVLGVYIV